MTDVKARMDSVDRKAEKEYSARVNNLYKKLSKEISKISDKITVDFKIDIGEILVPRDNTSAAFTKKFNRAKVKILRSIEHLVHSLIAGRNEISLFSMFGSKGQQEKSYLRRYNKIKQIALNRLETGVGLIKFRRDQDVPISTILFPSRNTKFYTLRYNLLKHKMLNKVNKGINNITFVTPVRHQSFKLSQAPVKTKVEVPIGDFLIPTPNTKFYALRFNWLKHKMLNKVSKGIGNITFVAPVKHQSFKLSPAPLKTKVEVPIESFLIPTGNSWVYTIRYNLLKHKFLSKVSKGIKAINFTGADLNIGELMLPTEGVDREQFNKAVTKAIVKKISKTKSKSEYADYRRRKFEEMELNLDKARNALLRTLVGKGGKVIDSRLNPQTGIYEPKGSAMGAGAMGGLVSTVAMKAAPYLMKALPALAVAGAGIGGYALGTLIDKKFGISDKIANKFGEYTDKKLLNERTEAFEHRFRKSQNMDAKAFFWRGGGSMLDSLETKELFWKKSQSIVADRATKAKQIEKWRVEGTHASEILKYDKLQAADKKQREDIVAFNTPMVESILGDLVTAATSGSNRNAPRTVIVNQRGNGDTVFGAESRPIEFYLTY